MQPILDAVRGALIARTNVVAEQLKTRARETVSAERLRRAVDGGI